MIHGILLIDKPTGLTSHDVVAKVRRQLHQKSVGHAGTLDPLASGLLVILLGEATKISDYLLNEDKGYQVDVAFGTETDTWDVTGKITNQSDATVAADKAIPAALSLVGEAEYPVPMYSAIKIKGKKLYEYARAEQEIEVPLREMNFYDVKNVKFSQQVLSCDLKCHKGGYIRSWAVTLGQKLGVPSTMKALRRTLSSPYSVYQAISLERFLEVPVEDLGEWRQEMGASFVPLAETLQHCKALTVKGRDERLLCNGQIPIDLDKRLLHEQKKALKLQKNLGIRIFSGDSGELISILEARPNKGLRVRRIFQLK